MPSRTIRALFLWDQDDFAGALEDFDAIATTAYLLELASRYRAAERDPAAALDLADLPPVLEPVDHYVAGFHAMRRNDYVAAAELLADERISSWRHAAELRLVWRYPRS